MGFNVNYSYIEDNCLYAASKEAGLYRGVLKNNLIDKNNWEKTGNFKEQTKNSTTVYDTTNKYWWTVKEGKLTYYTLNTDKEKYIKQKVLFLMGLHLTNSTVYILIKINYMQ